MSEISTPIKAIWISGLSSAGKTTLARLVIKRLQEKGYPCLLIDGNETRNLFDNRFGFDPISRRKQTRRMKSLAMWVIRQKIIPVVAMIHPFEDDRVKCRKEIPGYHEVFLNCDINECIRRDKKNVYMPVIKGEKKFVVGLDIPYEEQKNADLILESDQYSPEVLLGLLWDNIKDKLYDNRLTDSLFPQNSNQPLSQNTLAQIKN
jgi:adenylylsulfate kinase-like enzyme|tara:strand:+ start:258 stop:872 length:615 start_codon:yes stop_codon:yes gene_type:complete